VDVILLGASPLIIQKSIELVFNRLSFDDTDQNNDINLEQVYQLAFDKVAKDKSQLQDYLAHLIDPLLNYNEREQTPIANIYQLLHTRLYYILEIDTDLSLQDCMSVIERIDQIEASLSTQI
jgi:hypothetical protein